MNAVLALALVAGCGRLSFDPRADASDASGQGDTSPSDTLGTGPFGTPVDLGELRINGVWTDDPMPSTDELTMVFTAEGNVTNACDIWIATRPAIGQPFGAPVEIAGNINNAGCQAGPTWSADELSLVYAEDVGGNNFDLLESTRATATDPWPAGTTLTIVNSPASEIGPSLTADGLRMVLYSQRAGTFDLYETTRASRASAWAAPTLIAELATGADEDSPHISPDGLSLWFVADSSGNHDVYTTSRPALNMPFGAPVRIDEVSTAFDEDDPWVSADGHRIYFARYYATQDVRIFMASR